MGYVYILASAHSKRFYIGSTKDIERRLGQHNANYVTATAHKGPWIVQFKQAYLTIKEARQTEYRLKSFKRRDILELIIKEGVITMGL